MTRLTQKVMSTNGCIGGTSHDCSDFRMKGSCKGKEEENLSAYDKGMNNAWDLARRLFLSACDGVENALTDRDLNEIFETRDIAYIVNRYTPQEAQSKIEAWEKSKAEIKVGDVVMDTEDNVFCVLQKLKHSKYALLDSKGNHSYLTGNELAKTGRTIDIASVLEQIGGAV